MNPQAVEILLLSAMRAVKLDEDWMLDDADVELPESDNKDKWWLLLGEAQTIKRAITLVEKELKQALGFALPEGQATRLGGDVWKYSEKTHTVVAEGFGDFLGDDWQAVIRIDEGNVRRTALDAVAEQRGLNKWTVRNTFLPSAPTGELDVIQMPIDKAPKYQQGLEPGESVELMTRKKKGETT